MKMTIKSSKSKPDVEFPYGVRLFSKAEVVELCIISSAHDVMKLILLFYMCHSMMDLKRCYKTAVFYISIERV